MTVVMAGCGDLGSMVATRLAATGRAVLGLRRRPDRLPTGIAGRAVDLAGEVPELPAETSTLVITLTADSSDADAYRRTYLEGTRNVLRGLDAAGAAPERVLLVSSTAVYGQRDGQWVDERSDLAPSSATAEVLVETERMLQHELPHATVLRFSGLYGAGHTRMIDQVRAGTASIPPTVTYTNRIHRADAAAAAAWLCTMSERPDGVYLGSDHEPAERAEVLRFLAAELGAAEPEVAEQPSRGANKRCRNGRLLATGFEFSYPTYREGYRAVLGRPPC